MSPMDKFIPLQFCIIHKFNEHSSLFSIKMLNTGSGLTSAETLLFISSQLHLSQDWYYAFKNSDYVTAPFKKRKNMFIHCLIFNTSIRLVISTSAGKNFTHSSVISTLCSYLVSRNIFLLFKFCPCHCPLAFTSLANLSGGSQKWLWNTQCSFIRWYHQISTWMDRWLDGWLEGWTNGWIDM